MLAEEHKAIRRTVREFAEEKIAPAAEEYYETYETEGVKQEPTELIEQAAEMGLVGTTLPEEYGGIGMDHLSRLIIVEEVARVDTSFGGAVIGGAGGAQIIAEAGTERQKEAYIEDTAAGEKSSAVAITEPQAGSDVTGIETTAERDGDEYIINGNKIFITNGGWADYVVVFAKTVPRDENQSPHDISAFIVDTDQEGYTTQESELMGFHGESNATVYLDDVRTPAWKRIEEEGQAWYSLMDWFNNNRATVIPGFSIGLAQGALDQAFSYAEEREQFNRPLTEFQGIRWKFADMAADLEATRQLAYATVSKLDNGGEVSPKLSALNKVKATEMANEVVDEALQIHGGHGYTKDHKIERFYRDARVLRIFEGTNEIMRNIIANEMVQDGGYIPMTEN